MKQFAICSIAILMSAGVAEATMQELETLGSSAEHRGAVLFSDDFSVPSASWDITDLANGQARYVRGAMHVKAVTSGGSIFVPYDRSFSDVSIQVETRLVGGNDDNWQTVSCRHSSDGDYYDLGISADGYYMLDVWVDGRRQSKSIGPARSRHVRQGLNAVNVLLVECVGNQLSLSVNGHALAKLRDESHSTGKIALSVDGLVGRFSDVSFDNLVVTQR